MPDLRLGDAQLVDLGDNPVVSLDIPFDSLRFYIPQIALDEMANEAGIRRVKGLYAPNFGARDLVMFGLAQALAGAMEQPGDGTAMFSDCIALAFFAHIVHAYGSVPTGGRNARGGLAPWQLQRARDFINVNLAGDPSIAEVANECGLSSSYFARAFKQSTGVPPYRWLTKHASSAPKSSYRTRAGSSPISPSSAALSTKAISRAFFPGARVTVQDGGAASTAASSAAFLRADLNALTAPVWLAVPPSEPPMTALTHDLGRFVADLELAPDPGGRLATSPAPASPTVLAF